MTASATARENGLARACRRLRRQILELCAASGGHIVSSLSCVEILAALYLGGGLREATRGAARDRFLLSKGHAEAALYAVLAEIGCIPREWLRYSFRQGACHLGGHPDRSIPGVEITSGSLGHGLGIGAGIALARALDGDAGRVFVLLGDAECTEGSVWEAAQFAGHRKLGGLAAIVDRNGLGCLDRTEAYTGLEPFAEKWSACGWEVEELDGHDAELLAARLRAVGGSRPRVLIARTVKGKGVSFMENDPSWHVRGVDPGSAARARVELEERP